jgi:hypothetical protein
VGVSLVLRQHGGVRWMITSRGEREQSRDETEVQNSHAQDLAVVLLNYAFAEASSGSESSLHMCPCGCIRHKSADNVLLTLTILFKRSDIPANGQHLNRPDSLVQVPNNGPVQLPWRFEDLMSASIYQNITIVADRKHTVRRTRFQSVYTWWLGLSRCALTGSLATSGRHRWRLRDGAAGIWTS